MEETKRIVEIGGVKVEVDLRTAKRVDRFRVGDRVKLLVKGYGDSFKSHHGVIVAFDDFRERPTITVCYLEQGYNADLKFAAINQDTKDIEFCACNDDVLIEKGEVVARVNREIEKKEAEIADLVAKRNYFEQRFGAWFMPEQAE